MGLFITLLVLSLATIIFFGTLNITPGSKDRSIWVKVRLQVGREIQACWCRIFPDKNYKYYTLDGKGIKKDCQVKFVEPCLDSGVNNPIPGSIDDIITGNHDDSLSDCGNPFRCRH
ncbi:MAG: hypothetical protein ACFFG0_34640 [Candidatus Thorarchaeota archaeon]